MASVSKKRLSLRMGRCVGTGVRISGSFGDSVISAVTWYIWAKVTYKGLSLNKLGYPLKRDPRWSDSISSERKVPSSTLMAIITHCLEDECK